MATKFSARFNANYNRSKRLESAALNIYDNACRFYWLSSFINKAFNDMRAGEDYQRLPLRDRAYIDGAISAYRKLIDRQITHGYLCNDGKFRVDLAGCEKYAYPSDNSPKALIDGTCTSVWRNKPERVFFMSDDTRAVFETCRYQFAKLNDSTIEFLEVPRSA